MADVLAQQVVQFSVAGLDAVKSAMDAIKGGLSAVDATVQQVGQAVQSSLVGMAQRLIDGRAEVIALEAAMDSGFLERFRAETEQTNARLRELTFADRVAGSMEAMRDAAADATAQLEATHGLMRSGEWDQLAQATERANRQLRSLEFPQRVNEAMEEMHLKAERAQVQLVALRKAIDSGEYQQLAEQTRNVAEEMQRLKDSVAPLKAIPSLIDQLAEAMQRAHDADFIDEQAGSVIAGWSNALAGAAARVRALEEATSSGFMDQFRAETEQVAARLRELTFADKVAQSMEGMRDAAAGAAARLQAMQAQLATGEYQVLAADIADANRQLRELQFPERVTAAVDGFGQQLDAARVKIEALKQLNTGGASITLSGVDTFVAQTAQLNAQLRELERPIKVGLQLEGMAQQLEAGRIKIESLQQAFTSGAAQQFAADTAKIAEELRGLEFPQKVAANLEAMRARTDGARVSLEALKQSLASGEYVKNAVDVARITVEMERLKKAADWQVLKEQKGTIGAWASYFKEQIAGVAGQLSGALQSALRGTTQAIAATPAAIGMAVAGFQALTSSVRGWVNSGLAGTNYGNALSLQFSLLNQQIASVFVPTIQRVTNVVRDLGTWFRRLTGDQQDGIRRWIEAAAVMGVIFVAITKVKGVLIGLATSMVGTLLPAIGTLVTAIASGSGVVAASIGVATAGISVLIGLFVSAATAAVVFGGGIVVGTETGRSALSRLWNSLTPIIETLKGVGAEIWAAISPAIDAIGMHIGDLLSAVTGTAGQLAGVFRSMAPAIAGIANGIADAVGWLVQAATSAVQWFNNTIGIGAVLKAIGGAFVIVGAWIGGVLASIAAQVAVLAVIFSPVIVAVAAIGAAFVAVGYAIGRVIAGIWGPLTRLATTVWAAFKAVWEVLVAVGAAIFDALSSLFDLGDGFDGIISTLSEFTDWLAQTIPGAINTAIQAFASLLRTMAHVGHAFDLVLGTNTRDRLNALADRIAGIRVELNATARPGREEGRDRTVVGQAPGGFEGAEALWRRATESSVKNVAEERREAREERMVAALDRIEEHTRPRHTPRSVSPRAGAPGGTTAS